MTCAPSIRVEATKFGEVPLSTVLTRDLAEVFRSVHEDLGYTVKVTAPSCPLASGFKCWEGCASACKVRGDARSTTYSCGATIHAA